MVNSFENSKQNIVYTLSLDPTFSAFLVEGITWGKNTKSAPYVASLMTTQTYQWRVVSQHHKRWIFWSWR